MERRSLSGDLWGGLAATLVAIPSAIAFGVAIHAPLGAGSAAAGAFAGLTAAVVAGLIAPPLGGAPRIITEPCAPAAAVLGAFAAEAMGRPDADPTRIRVELALIGIGCGILQFVIGLVRGGTLIKYIPFPVISGYLSGVGVIIIRKQLPAFFGVDAHDVAGILARPGHWQPEAILVGVAALIAVIIGPRYTKLAPATVLGVSGGVAAFFVLGIFDRSLLSMSAHRLIIGPLPTHGASSGSSLWAAIGHLTGHDLETVAIPALTLSVLLSIDTLKTCVVTDAVTRTRHDSNRELRAQGLANFASGLAGGVPVAGTMGATMVNVSSGGTTRWSGIFEGIFMLLGVLVLRPVIAWTPLAALAGILVVVGFRMVNWKAFAMLRQPSTRFDFAVIAVVAGVAIGIGLITAAGVGLALAILLFIRDQVRGNVIRRKTYGSRVFSRSRRLPEEMEVLVQRGGETTILELQGNLFFGTTDQLQTDLQADLKTCRYLILDLRRVQSVDYTAVHLFEILEGQVAEKGGALVFAHVPPQLPTGQDLKAYFSELGLTGPHRHVHVFPEQSDALEWVEERTLAEALPGRLSSAARAGLSDLVLMRGLDPETVNRVAACAREVPVKRGEAIFRKGSSGDELFLVQRGTVRILLPMADGSAHHIATFGPGDFFGDMAFLDREIRSADAVAWEDCELLALSRARFDDLVKQDPVLGTRVFARLAKALAARLRYTDIEVGALSET